MMTLTFDDSVYVRFVRTKGTISSRSFDEEVVYVFVSCIALTLILHRLRKGLKIRERND